MKKSRQRQIKWLAQGHIASQWQSQYLDTGGCEFGFIWKAREPLRDYRQNMAENHIHILF